MTKREEVEEAKEILNLISNKELAKYLKVSASSISTYICGRVKHNDLAREIKNILKEGVKEEATGNFYDLPTVKRVDKLMHLLKIKTKEDFAKRLGFTRKALWSATVTIENEKLNITLDLMYENYQLKKDLENILAISAKYKKDAR